ncbi:MAG: endonuclease NucS [Acidimicrobiales bacterium]
MRQYPTDIGPVDLLCRSASGDVVAIEIKRRGEIDGVEQLTRYLSFLVGRASARLRGVRRPGDQAANQVLCGDRSILAVEVDYDELRGIERPQRWLF